MCLSGEIAIIHNVCVKWIAAHIIEDFLLIRNLQHAGEVVIRCPFVLPASVGLEMPLCDFKVPISLLLAFPAPPFHFKSASSLQGQ